MSELKHIIVCGEVGIGKSTLIQRLLRENSRSIYYGFVTERLTEEEKGFHPIYIHPAGTTERTYTGRNLIGTCNRKIHNINQEVFDTLGVQYLTAKLDGIIVMDELGFMESSTKLFCKAVLNALDGNIPVIAAVKSRFDVPFLNDVRTHKKVQLYTITKENRDALYYELLPLVRRWKTLQP